jgi:hypothetical protein
VHRMVWMKVCRFSSFSMCMWALCRMLPTPQDWVSKTCKSWCETNYTKKDFCTLDFPCTSTWRWSHFARAFTWVKQFPFGHFIIESHAHHFKCVHSFEGGIGNKAPPQKSKDNHIWLFLPRRCAPSLGEQPFQSICNGTHVNFAHPLQPHLNLIWIVLSYFSCFRGFIFSLNCPLKQQLKLKQKNY